MECSLSYSRARVLARTLKPTERFVCVRLVWSRGVLSSADAAFTVTGRIMQPCHSLRGGYASSPLADSCAQASAATCAGCSFAAFGLMCVNNSPIKTELGGSVTDGILAARALAKVLIQGLQGHVKSMFGTDAGHDRSGHFQRTLKKTKECLAASRCLWQALMVVVKS